MQENEDDAVLLRRQRQFLHEIEQSIRESNRQIIHGLIPELTKERFVEFALVVARLRASYLEAAVALARGGPDAAEGEGVTAALRQHRVAYDEAREAFDALQRAIERGYVDIGQ
jgi:hypothetical protein